MSETLPNEFVKQTIETSTDLGIDRSAPRIVEVLQLWNGTLMEVRHLDQEERRHILEFRETSGDIIEGTATRVILIQRNVLNECGNRCSAIRTQIGRRVGITNRLGRARLGQRHGPANERRRRLTHVLQHAWRANSPDQGRCPRSGGLMDRGVHQHDP